MSRRLSDQIAQWVEEALDTYLLGDSATFDVGLLVDPQHGPVVVLALYLPSLIVGEHLQSVGAMPNPPSVTPEQVHAFVRDALEAMRDQRSKMAAGPPNGAHSLLVAGR